MKERKMLSWVLLPITSSIGVGEESGIRMDDYLSQIGYKVYPSPADKNESCILNRSAWDIFESIDGFNNTPSVITVIKNYNTSINISLKEKDEIFCKVGLTVGIFEKTHTANTTKLLTIKIESHILRNFTVQSNNIVDVDGDIYGLTGSLDNNNSMVDIFVLITNDNIADVPHYYAVFYLKADLEKGSIGDWEPIYFEKRGGYGPTGGPSNSENTENTENTGQNGYEGYEFAGMLTGALVLSLVSFVLLKKRIFKKQ